MKKDGGHGRATAPATRRPSTTRTARPASAAAAGDTRIQVLVPGRDVHRNRTNEQVSEMVRRIDHFAEYKMPNCTLIIVKNYCSHNSRLM